MERLRFVAQALTELSELGICPRPLNGGVGVTSRHVPVAYLVSERRLGKPLDVLLQQRQWSPKRARRLVANLALAIARVHATGWWLGDFEHGNNVVLVQGQPLFVDIGLSDDEDDEGPDYGEDVECLASIARKLGERTGDDVLLAAADSLDHRRERRLDRRSFGVWLKRNPIEP